MKKLLSLLLLLALFASVLSSCGPPEDPDPADTGSDASWEDAYAQGVKYMIEGDVENANVCFREATECPDPAAKCYAALADSHLLLGNETDALDASIVAGLDDYKCSRVSDGISFLSTEGTCMVTAVYYDEDGYSPDVKTKYAVTVMFSCPDGVDCTVVCGANCDHPGYTTILGSAEVTGTGAVQFIFETAAAKGAGDMFGFYSELYETAQSGTWKPYLRSATYYIAETDYVLSEPVTEEDLDTIIHLLSGNDMSLGLGDMIHSDPMFLSRYTEGAKGDEAPLMLSLASAATNLIAGGDDAPDSTPVLNTYDWDSDEKFYQEMKSSGIMTDSEIAEAKNKYYTQYVSLDWVQLFFDRIYGDGVIDVYSWDYSGTVKTASGYVGLQPFGVETPEYYTFTYKDFKIDEFGALVYYTYLRTSVDLDGVTTYYDGNSDTPLKNKEDVTVQDNYVVKDSRGVHFSPPGASMNQVFYVTAESGLRLRKGPGTDYETVKVFPHRHPLFIYEVQDGWGRVSREEDGWVSMDYVDDLVAEIK